MLRLIRKSEEELAAICTYDPFRELWRTASSCPVIHPCGGVRAPSENEMLSEDIAALLTLRYLAPARAWIKEIRVRDVTAAPLQRTVQRANNPLTTCISDTEAGCFLFRSRQRR